MDFFRVFPWNGVSTGAERFGPLHVARALQGASRHGCPERYGVLYCAREPTSAVAESIQGIRGHALSTPDLSLEGMNLALVQLRLRDSEKIIDLDAPANLADRGLRPSKVATGNRPATQAVAVQLFEEGASGFLWWSTLEAAWINASLFLERVAATLQVVGQPRILTLQNSELLQAADRLGIAIEP